ncbi:MAG: hypothetical protein ACXAC7_05880 [Candidatus Hodarchaeales archaeon]|jgi:hypothetical protein
MMNIKTITKTTFHASEQVNYIKNEKSSTQETEYLDPLDDLKAIYHNAALLFD